MKMTKDIYTNHEMCEWDDWPSLHSFTPEIENMKINNDISTNVWTGWLTKSTQVHI